MPNTGLKNPNPPKPVHKSRTVLFNAAIGGLVVLSQNTDLLTQLAVALGVGGGAVVPAIAVAGVVGNIVLRAMTNTPITVPGITKK